MTDTNPLGTGHTITETATTGGAPVIGVQVNFSALTGLHVRRTASSITNRAGQPTSTSTRHDVAGTDAIQAGGSVSSQTFSGAATNPRATLMAAYQLTPAADTNLMGTNHTVMATVRREETPLPGP